jgi:hypothetical protein
MQRSTEGEMRVVFLVEVLDACQNAGLVVAVSICNKSANSVKSLKRFGVSKKKPYFRFRDEESAAVFDPSHLLQCTCILLVKHVVTNVGFEFNYRWIVTY